ncbi:hypothetical protein B7P25_15400 [Bacillus thuringiensis]|nr:hypothetical protein B7P25_15400 [Bacillus thuringiensis]
MTCKKYHTVSTKITNLFQIKTGELKALDCLRKTTSAFLLDRHVINV